MLTIKTLELKSDARETYTLPGKLKNVLTVDYYAGKWTMYYLAEFSDSDTVVREKGTNVEIYSPEVGYELPSNFFYRYFYIGSTFDEQHRIRPFYMKLIGAVPIDSCCEYRGYLNSLLDTNHEPKPIPTGSC